MNRQAKIIAALSILLLLSSGALIMKNRPTAPPPPKESPPSAWPPADSAEEAAPENPAPAAGDISYIADHELTAEQAGIPSGYQPTIKDGMAVFSGKSPLNRKIEFWTSFINGSGEMAGKIYPHGRAYAEAGKSWSVSIPTFALSEGRNQVDIAYSVSDSDGEYGSGMARISFDAHIPEFKPVAVKWQAEQKAVPVKDVGEYVGADIRTAREIDGYSSEAAYTLVGQVQSGEYSGDSVYRISNGCPMGSDVCVEALAIADPAKRKFHVLTRYSGAWEGDNSPIGKIADADGYLIMPDLEAPISVALKAKGYEITRTMVATGLADQPEAKKIGKAADGSDIFQYDDNRPAIRLKNGELIKYEMPLPFYSGRIPDITWVDGTAAKDDYTQLTQHGCGGTAWMVQPDGFGKSGLALGGRTSTGEPVYFSQDHADAQSLYGVLASWKSDKPSYDEFLSAKPVFYWQDPFGRWIRWNTASAMPMAECGKPVVYLYPEKTEKVGVKLGRNIEVTKSEPLYGSGWSVTAQPDGTITGSDGAAYPYLYWEGNGASYAAPKGGWSVAAADADAFLSSKLSQLGLNAKEAKDFKDFWLPIVTQSPYARISFVPQAEWNRAAPLSVSPAPQSVIRVFMDWQPLSSPISIEPQILPSAPARSGFTAVEWGGLLYR